MADQQVPSVGRVVHYVAFGTPSGEFPAGIHRAAMITEVYFQPLPDIDDDVQTEARTETRTSEIDVTQAAIVVFNPIGIIFREHAPFDPTGQTPGSWHWPEFVPPKKAE